MTSRTRVSRSVRVGAGALAEVDQVVGDVVAGAALTDVGLAELPGASEHWEGDVVMWLVFVLPIPILAGVTLLAAARWLWRHRIGARGATAVWLVLVVIATIWILGVVAFLVGQGNYVRLDDPLLWAPIAGLVGSIAGVVLLAVIEVRRRVSGTARLPHG